MPQPYRKLKKPKPPCSYKVAKPIPTQRWPRLRDIRNLKFKLGEPPKIVFFLVYGFAIIVMLLDFFLWRP